MKIESNIHALDPLRHNRSSQNPQLRNKADPDVRTADPPEAPASQLRRTRTIASPDDDRPIRRSPVPIIVERAEQPYVGIRGLVTMPTIGAIADRIPEVFAWLGARGIEPAGAPFLKYNLIDMARELEIEAGVPVAA